MLPCRPWSRTLRGPACALLAGCLALLAACAMPGDAAPLVKVGVVAPFEGLGRSFGYSVLPAIKVAVDEANASAALGRYRAALVVLNDDDDPATAAQQVRGLAQDADVVVVLGPWTGDTAAAAIPAYAAAALPALVPAPVAGTTPGVRSACPPLADIAGAMLARAATTAGSGGVAVSGPENALAGALRQAAGKQAGVGGAARDAAPALRLYSGDAAQAADDLLAWRAAGWQGILVGGPDLARPWLAGRAGSAAEGSQAAVCSPGSAPSAAFSAAYRTAAGGEAGPEARLAYAAAHAALDAVAADIHSHGRPTRSGVAAALAAQHLSAGLVWLRMAGGQWTTAGE